ncbi:MAG TPA: MATE family efflux transporter [Levilinea sp.]|nr:MATE family efflux transporter [Levilinea sp.]
MAHFKDSTYFKTLVRIAFPIAVQHFVTSSLNAVDVIMVGQLGETALAAVGLANQVFFLLMLLLFGVSSGAGMFTAQFWGKRDVESIHKVLGIGLLLATGSSLIFTLAALFFPETILGIYSKDPAVVALGSAYLRRVAYSYIFTSITFSFASVLRSTENVKLPMFVSIVALSLNTALNYALIFGNFGFPQMGVEGAAIATVIARSLECITLVLLTYRLRTVVAARVSELFGFSRAFVQRYLKIALPVMFNEMMWSLGITIYNIVYARIGTESIAAVNISVTIEGMAIVLFIGISNAAAIMIGNHIGAGEEFKAFDYGRRTLMISISGAVIVGVGILTSKDLMLSLYQISDITRQNASMILTIMSFSIWVRVANMTMIVGIFRSGGDTRFSFALDVGSIWLVGVPLALIGAFVFHFPVYGVVLMIMAEEFVKMLIGLWRFSSRKWINNLTQTMVAASGQA